MSFSRWQKLSDRMIAKVVLLALSVRAEADDADADAAIGAVGAAIVLSVMAALL
jgi:hypothetical protein